MLIIRRIKRTPAHQLPASLILSHSMADLNRTGTSTSFLRIYYILSPAVLLTVTPKAAISNCPYHLHNYYLYLLLLGILLKVLDHFSGVLDSRLSFFGTKLKVVPPSPSSPSPSSSPLLSLLLPYLHLLVIQSTVILPLLAINYSFTTNNNLNVEYNSLLRVSSFLILTANISLQIHLALKVDASQSSSPSAPTNSRVRISLPVIVSLCFSSLIPLVFFSSTSASASVSTSTLFNILLYFYAIPPMFTSFILTSTLIIERRRLLIKRNGYGYKNEEYCTSNHDDDEEKIECSTNKCFLTTDYKFDKKSKLFGSCWC